MVLLPNPSYADPTLPPPPVLGLGLLIYLYIRFWTNELARHVFGNWYRVFAEFGYVCSVVEADSQTAPSETAETAALF